MEFLINVLGLAACVLVGFALGYVSRQYLGTSKVKAAQEEADKLVAEAKTKQKEMLLEAKDEVFGLLREGEDELKNRRSRVRDQEERLHKRQEALERRLEPLENRERSLVAQEARLKGMEDELEELKRKRVEELEIVSSMTREEARDVLLKAVEEESRQDMARVNGPVIMPFI